MTIEDVINRLNQLGPWELLDMHKNALSFRRGCREYQLWRPSMEVHEVTDEGFAFNAHSEYLRNLLLGKKRNNAGEFVEKTKTQQS